MAEHKCPRCGEPAPTWVSDTWRNESGSSTRYVLPCRHVFENGEWPPKPTIEYEIRLPLNHSVFKSVGRPTFEIDDMEVRLWRSLYVWSDGVVTAKDER